MATKINIDDYIGQKFNKLAITKIWRDNNSREIKCIAKCDNCQNEKEFRFRNIRDGLVKTCGCKHQKIILDNLIGQKFNRLTILEAKREQQGKDSHEQVYVKCKCECGNIIECRLSSLKNNTIQSCGCFHRERSSQTNITVNLNQLIGQKFGKLTIISAERKSISNGKRKRIYVKTKCECGNIKEYLYYALKNTNGPKSCGCIKKPAKAKYNLEDLVGQKYGKLEILSAYRNNRSEIRVKCKCECGREKDIKFRNLLSGETKSCGICNNIDLDSLVGQKFNKLTILSAYRENDKIKVKARCDCGNEKIFFYHSLMSGHTQSCGCNKVSANGESTTRLYSIWQKMKARCYDANNNRYEHYGQRGIIVCDEWKNNFENFKHWALNNGYSDDLSIDRINNNGNYEPSNCRWATDIEQANNKSNNKYIIINNETKTLAEWSRIYKIHPSTVGARIRRGWDPLKALTIATKK